MGMVYLAHDPAIDRPVAIKTIHRRLIESSEDDPSVAVVDLHERIPPRVVGLVWHSDRHRSAAAEAFTDSALAVCRKLSVEPAAA